MMDLQAMRERAENAKTNGWTTIFTPDDVLPLIDALTAAQDGRDLITGLSARVGLRRPPGPMVSADVWERFSKPGEAYADPCARSRVARRYALDRYGRLVDGWWNW